MLQKERVPHCKKKEHCAAKRKSCMTQCRNQSFALQKERVVRCNPKSQKQKALYRKTKMCCTTNKRGCDMMQCKTNKHHAMYKKRNMP